VLRRGHVIWPRAFAHVRTESACMTHGREMHVYTTAFAHISEEVNLLTLTMREWGRPWPKKNIRLQTLQVPQKSILHKDANVASAKSDTMKYRYFEADAQTTMASTESATKFNIFSSRREMKSDSLPLSFGHLRMLCQPQSTFFQKSQRSSPGNSSLGKSV
jgi:hypothetical protein